MKSSKLCIIAFVAGVGIAAATQTPVLETLGYLPDDVVETETTETDTSKLMAADPGSQSRPVEDNEFNDSDGSTSTVVASRSGSEPASSAPAKSETETGDSQPSPVKQSMKQSASKAMASSSFERGVFKVDGFELPYRLRVPDFKKAGAKKYPLLVFLHGAGERGSDNSAQLKHGSQQLEAWIKKNGADAFLLFPQCPEDDQWTDHVWTETKHTMQSKPTQSMTALLGLVDEMLETQPIDLQRVYTAGLSMGGYGVFDLVARRPGMFAAAAPLCGGTDFQPASLKKILPTPLFIVHGSKDTVVNVENSRQVVEALRENGANPIYIELYGVDHDCWSTTFEDDTLFNWLFTKRNNRLGPDRSVAESNPGAIPQPTSKAKKVVGSGSRNIAATKSKNISGSGSRNAALKKATPKVTTPRAPQIAAQEASKTADKIAEKAKMPAQRVPGKTVTAMKNSDSKPKPNQPKRVVVAKPAIKDVVPAKEASPGSKTNESAKGTAPEVAKTPEVPKKAVPAKPAAPTADENPLDGNWYVTRALHAGRKVDFGKLKTMTMEIAGDQIQIVQGNKRELAAIERGEVRQIGETSFAELKITSPRGGKEIRGFYYFDSNELTMIWGAPGAERPDPTDSEDMKKARILTLQEDKSN